MPDETVLAPAVVQHMLLLSYRRKLPLVGLSESQAKMGALLSLSLASAEDIGRQAGELANSILGGRPPTEAPYTTARRVQLTVNLKAAGPHAAALPQPRAPLHGLVAGRAGVAVVGHRLQPESPTSPPAGTTRCGP